MLDRALPKYIDNTFRGQRIAVWLFVLIVFVKIAQSLAVLFGGRSVLSSADGIPIDTYTPAAAQTVVSLWALLGLTRLWICLLCILALVRYRSMIPLMFGVLLLHDIGKELVLHFFPIVRAGTPPGPAVNMILLALTIIGFVLSLWARHDPTSQPA
jgi:hypothetical protein